MAIATSSNYYQNAIVGTPMAGSDINVLDRHTTPKYAVGFGFTRGDGNKFRYVHYGSAVNTPNVLVGCSNTNNCIAAVSGTVIAPATAQAVANEKITAGSIGSRFIEIALTTVAANQYAGGYLAITKNTGAGFTYRIRGNTATNTPTTGNFRMELYEPFKVAIDNTSCIAVTPSFYSDLSACSAITTSYNVAGVAMSNASADNWGWICTHGVVGCLVSDSGVVGKQVVLTNGTAAGAVRSIDFAAALTNANLATIIPNSPAVGTLIVAPRAAGENGMIYLTLE